MECSDTNLIRAVWPYAIVVSVDRPGGPVNSGYDQGGDEPHGQSLDPE